MWVVHAGVQSSTERIQFEHHPVSKKSCGCVYVCVFLSASIRWNNSAALFERTLPLMFAEEECVSSAVKVNWLLIKSVVVTQTETLITLSSLTLMILFFTAAGAPYRKSVKQTGLRGADENQIKCLLCSQFPLSKHRARVLCCVDFFFFFRLGSGSGAFCNYCVTGR